MNKTDEIENLHNLEKIGAITKEEFEIEKKKILSGTEENAKEVKQHNKTNKMLKIILLTTITRINISGLGNCNWNWLAKVK